MKQNVLVISVIIILLASACAPKAAPTMNPADIQGTAQAAAFTLVAQTQQAQPTNTPLPIETASPIPLPTDTQAPLPALDTPSAQDTLAAPGVLLPTALPTFTLPALSNSSNSNADPCNQPLTSWQGPTAHFSVSNQTKPQGTIVLSLYVVTEMGQCGYIIVTNDGFSGPAGQYSAAAFINGKKNMKAFGSFKVTGGNWKIVVKNDVISAAGSCYPDC